jgi:hypothetical protein
MIREVFDKINPILNQYFSEVGEYVVEKLVTANRFITTAAPALLAP